MLARKALGYAVLGFVLLGVPLAAVAQSKGFVATVESLKPIAYYRLDATSGSSVVGSTTFTSAGGATSATPGAPIGAAGNGYVQFNGVDGMITTTQLGGVGSAGKRPGPSPGVRSGHRTRWCGRGRRPGRRSAG